jgi:hypothetical protein
MNETQAQAVVELLTQIAEELREIKGLMKGDVLNRSRRLEDIQAKVGTLVQVLKR